MDISKLENFVLEKISRTRLPSLVILLVEDGETRYSKAFGFRDYENALPADIDTVYGIGSITKSFTAFSIMSLVEEGR
ncbi:MAG: serine hydrolase, partial [Sulfolobales archaeon]